MAPSHDYMEAEIGRVTALLRDACEGAARAVGISYEAMMKAVIETSKSQARDGRAIDWRVRVRLYGEKDGFEEAFADTDPGADPGAPGETVVSGLPAVASFAVDVAVEHHDQACSGLDGAAMGRKLRSLRTQLAYRANGTGRILADYAINDRGTMLRCRMACDVVRVTGDEAPERRLPGAQREAA